MVQDVLLQRLGVTLGAHSPCLDIFDVRLLVTRTPLAWKTVFRLQASLMRYPFLFEWGGR